MGKNMGTWEHASAARAVNLISAKRKHVRCSFGRKSQMFLAMILYMHTGLQSNCLDGPNRGSLLSLC